MTVRVIVVDDQSLVRQGICGLLDLTAEIEVLGEAADGVAALALLDTLEPDVVLLDLRMPRLDGLGVLTALAQRPSPPPVLVLTTFDDDEAVMGALRAGARGYLLKDVTLDQLVDAIRTVAAGGRLVQPSVTRSLVDRLVGDAVPVPSADRFGPPPSLTDRELDVVRLVAAGYSNREIAQALHLAEGTVKNHVSSILTKLGARDRTRAVLKAIECGLVRG